MDMSSTHHHSSSGAQSAAHMDMTFFGSQRTPLFSSNWSPSGTGSYAGTCVFLVILAIVNRLLFAGKVTLEKRWMHKEMKRRPIVVRGKSTGITYLTEGEEKDTGTLISDGGVEAHVKVMTKYKKGPYPWRLSVDFPRACYFTVLAATTYLLYVFSNAS